jgi:hypothetical protein
MTEEQVESITQILFTWWKRDFESRKISQKEADMKNKVSDIAINSK